MAVDPSILDSNGWLALLGTARTLLATHPSDPLRARTALDHAYPHLTGAAARAALGQATLQLRARARFGSMADALLWTDAGLAAASRPACTRRRAQRLLAAGVTEVADLTCGLGLDAIGFAAAGLRVVGVERDEAIAEMARRNVANQGLTDRVTIVAGSCEEAVGWAELPRQAWFVDPARRHPDQVRADGSHIRLDDPEQWSPQWSWVQAQIGVPEVLLAKAAPGIDHQMLVPPSGTGGRGITTEVEWVSEDGQLLEAAPLWRRQVDTTGLASAAVQHRAVVLGDPPLVLEGADDGRPLLSTLTASPPDPGEILVDPDPAVVRAGLVTDLAEAVGGRLVDERLAYLVLSEPIPQAWRAAARRQWLVLWSGKYQPGVLRAVCADRGIDRVEVTGRGRLLPESRVRRDLGLDRRRQHPVRRTGTLITMGIGPDRRTIAVLGRNVTEA